MNYSGSECALTSVTLTICERGLLGTCRICSAVRVPVTAPASLVLAPGGWAGVSSLMFLSDARRAAPGGEAREWGTGRGLRGESLSGMQTAASPSACHSGCWGPIGRARVGCSQLPWAAHRSKGPWRLSELRRSKTGPPSATTGPASSLVKPDLNTTSHPREHQAPVGGDCQGPRSPFGAEPGAQLHLSEGPSADGLCHQEATSHGHSRETPDGRGAPRPR